MIDFPYGNSSCDIRAYSITSAKENGAKEVEICHPVSLFEDADFRKIYEDILNLRNIAKKINISLRYVISEEIKPIPDGVKTKLSRLLSVSNLDNIGLKFNNTTSHTDNIIKMRFFKSKLNAKIKIITDNLTKDDFSSYIKAGADIIGLPIKQAPFIIHAYEEMINKS